MNYNYKNLVFEGGGVKGIAFGGALEIVNNRNLLSGIKRVAGTSAGAINATLLALGYSSEDVSKIISQTNFKDFEDGNILSEIIDLTKHYGWFKGDKFKEWIGNYIAQKTGKPDFTFGELFQQVQRTPFGAEAKQFKLLYMVATNLSQQKAEVLSHETYPNLPIRDAVRMSMSIPLFFQSVIKENDVMVDGGVSWNYPINLFDYKKYVSDPQNYIKAEESDNPDYVFNYETLGFRLDSKQVIEYAKQDWASEPQQINNLKEYSGALVNFLMEMANKSHLQPKDWNRTVFLDTLDVKTVDFKLPEEKIQALIASGKTCTENYFKWRDADPLWGKLPV